jgi:hypothetical protein
MALLNIEQENLIRRIRAAIADALSTEDLALVAREELKTLTETRNQILVIEAPASKLLDAVERIVRWDG